MATALIVTSMVLATTNLGTNLVTSVGAERWTPWNRDCCHVVHVLSPSYHCGGTLQAYRVKSLQHHPDKESRDAAAAVRISLPSEWRQKLLVHAYCLTFNLIRITKPRMASTMKKTRKSRVFIATNVSEKIGTFRAFQGAWGGSHLG